MQRTGYKAQRQLYGVHTYIYVHTVELEMRAEQESGGHQRKRQPSLKLWSLCQSVQMKGHFVKEQLKEAEAEGCTVLIKVPESLFQCDMSDDFH